MSTEGTHKVFVLEHDALERNEACEALARMKCEVRAFSKADELMAALDEDPDVCILELETPGANGLEICRSLRSRGNSRTHVILTSADDDMQQRLSAYDAGSNDYCVKPIAPEELGFKVDTVLRSRSELKELNARLNLASTTAFSAMTSMAEMGTVMSFMRGVFACKSFEHVAREIMDACRNYDLRTLVSVQFDGKWHDFNQQGKATPLENSLLEQARSNDRITQFAGRLSIGYPHVAILIMNFPRDDEERAGRLRDHLAFVVEAANIRLTVLEQDAKRLARTEMILNAISGLMRMVDYLRERQQNQRNFAMRMIADQSEAIARSFYCMGLSDAQEQTILNLVTQYSGEICNQLQSFGQDQERMLEGIIDTMHSIADE